MVRLSTKVSWKYPGRKSCSALMLSKMTTKAIKQTTLLPCLLSLMIIQPYILICRSTFVQSTLTHKAIFSFLIIQVRWLSCLIFSAVFPCEDDTFKSSKPLACLDLERTSDRQLSDSVKLKHIKSALPNINILVIEWKREYTYSKNLRKASSRLAR